MLSRLFQRQQPPAIASAYVTKIDIGCGAQKDEGYFGIDTFDGPSVDLKIDLTRDALPFADSSIDHAVSYHCLEHLPNYGDVVGEVWRVLKPNAQFFVAVPYFNNHINFANRFHVQHFNEHSFRFFSSEPATNALPERLWKFHFTPTWGLKGSANSATPVEFRTCRIEIDYYREFQGLPDHEKEALRLARPNVAHNICFYLQAIKPGAAAATLQDSDLIIPPRRRWMIANSW